MPAKRTVSPITSAKRSITNAIKKLKEEGSDLALMAASKLEKAFEKEEEPKAVEPVAAPKEMTAEEHINEAISILTEKGSGAAILAIGKLKGAQMKLESDNA